MSRTRKIKIVFVGQIPPPYGGQAVMNEALLKLDSDKIQLIHVSMNFSKSMDQVGKYSFRKVVHLVGVILNITKARIKSGAKILYYPPAGNDKIPILRDIIILISTRWMFKKVVFHFHAMGVSLAYSKLNSIMKLLFKKAYFKPNLSIQISNKNIDDANFIESESTEYIKNGIESIDLENIFIPNNEIPNILFLNLIRETKGIFVLLDSLAILRKKGIRFKCTIAGKFESKELEISVRKLLKLNNIQNEVNFIGEVSGLDKWKVYRNADIFCLPSFHETFGLVLIEAMMCSLPVIATDWGASLDIVDENCGFICPQKDIECLADSFERLILDNELRIKMGKKGRENFLNEFTLEEFHKNIEKTLLNNLS